MLLKKSVIAMQACGLLALSPQVFAADSTSNNEQETDVVEVHGRALTLYKSNEASLGTRTVTTIDQTPQSIQILTHDLIEDQAANEVTDLFRSMSGVSYFNYGIVKIRGFEQESEVLYDGLKGDPFRTFTIPQLFNIDQVQVLKGPSGSLYGAGEAGGVINYVTKKPTYTPETTLEITGGNKDFLSGSFESSGPANEDGSQRYRIGLYSSGEDSYRNNVEEENQILDVGYAWDINDYTTLTLQYSYFYQLGERLRGVPIDSSGNFLADSSWSSNEPDDYQKFQANIVQAHVDHEVNDWLDSHFAFRAYETKETIKFHQARALVDTDDDGEVDSVSRRYQDQVRYYKGIDLGSYLVGDFGAHTVVVGSDYHFASEDEVFYYSGTTSADSGAESPSYLSLSDPAYDDDISSYVLTLNRDRSTDVNQAGIYAQDQWQATDKLNLVFGARADFMEQKVVDHDDGSDNAYYHDWGYSARVGATYEVNPQFKPYTSYSLGMTPQDASDQVDAADGLLDPEENTQIEIGARSYLFDNRININTALYHIVKENIAYTDDDDLIYAIGDIRSQGFEMDVLAQITPLWVANVSYTYNDLSTTDNENEARALSNSPHNQLGVWTRHEIPALDSSIAFGASYASKQKDRDDNTIKSYTVYDMSWQTQWQDWKFQANVKNLFDKEYAIAGFTTESGAIVGERRRIYLKAAYSF
ncbi:MULTISPECIES: TonB-dependent siderophore receptor [unclassified Vibrio]|uniref:TonB-dependent receptor n=1 Tax=Vibrio sp. HB236076 TaxID=3232307 RepID=A0AB39HFA2_9VIBR|nr:TonB-dependent receptor [Vibrio sp. HB161653]MDP5253904.1 TonB-dependent receptor [Vibrio sp. HB161653]